MLRLRRTVADGRHERVLRRPPLGEQGLGEPLFREAADLVSAPQDRKGRAVILFQYDDPSLWVKHLGKSQDVADLGGAKRIDRLRVIADDRQTSAIGLEGQQDFGLKAVG